MVKHILWEVWSATMLYQCEEKLVEVVRYFENVEVIEVPGELLARIVMEEQSMLLVSSDSFIMEFAVRLAHYVEKC